MFSIRILLPNQILGRRNEVVKHILLFVQHPRSMPLFSKLRTTAQVGHGENSTVFKPKITISRKARSHADIESTIAGQQSRILAVQGQTLLVENEHRNLGSNFRREPNLIDPVSRRINRRHIHSGPEFGNLVLPEIDAINAGRYRERLESEKSLVAVPLPSDSRDRTQSRQLHIRQQSPIRRENL